MSGTEKNQDGETGGKNPDESKVVDFHGAAIIGEDGQEIPITEDMIKDACKKLDPALDGAPEPEEVTKKD